ncbi:unnamed protein product [Prorocentrum cordatum]|uniref:Uncharacterized protein n=1 Tax=Prorocentrum cordatum TaxID=2364126 RepID=A0ABN9VUW6_9DINO|nr:unnamed protein product [Polarella glacialis]
MDLDVTIQTSVTVTAHAGGSRISKWSPKVVMARGGTHACVVVNPRDRPLTRTVARLGGLCLDGVNLKKASLSDAAGHMMLKELRQHARPKLLVKQTHQAAASSKLLADERVDKYTTPVKTSRAQRPSRSSVADICSRREICSVSLTDDVCVEMLQSPSQADDVVVKATSENIMAVARFIAQHLAAEDRGKKLAVEVGAPSEAEPVDLSGLSDAEAPADAPHD